MKSVARCRFTRTDGAETLSRSAGWNRSRRAVRGEPAAELGRAARATAAGCSTASETPRAPVDSGQDPGRGRTYEAGSVEPLGRSPPSSASYLAPRSPRLRKGRRRVRSGRAGGREPYIKSAGGSAVRASLAVCRRDRECRGKATAEDRALRSGYPMLGLSAAAARAICWSTRTAKRNRHTAAWAGSQRCLSL